MEAVKRHHEDPSRLKWEDVNSAFAGRIIVGRIYNTKYKLPNDFLQAAKVPILEKLKAKLIDTPNFKFNCELKTRFIIKKADEEIEEDMYFNSKMHLITRGKIIKKNLMK